MLVVLFSLIFFGHGFLVEINLQALATMHGFSSISYLAIFKAKRVIFQYGVPKFRIREILQSFIIKPYLTKQIRRILSFSGKT